MSVDLAFLEKFALAQDRQPLLKVSDEHVTQ